MARVGEIMTIGRRETPADPACPTSSSAETMRSKAPAKPVVRASRPRSGAARTTRSPAPASPTSTHPAHLAAPSAHARGRKRRYSFPCRRRLFDFSTSPTGQPFAQDAIVLLTKLFENVSRKRRASRHDRLPGLKVQISRIYSVVGSHRTPRGCAVIASRATDRSRHAARVAQVVFVDQVPVRRRRFGARQSPSAGTNSGLRARWPLGVHAPRERRVMRFDTAELRGRQSFRRERFDDDQPSAFCPRRFCRRERPCGTSLKMVRVRRAHAIGRLACANSVANSSA